MPSTVYHLFDVLNWHRTYIDQREGKIQEVKFKCSVVSGKIENVSLSECCIQQLLCIRNYLLVTVALLSSLLGNWLIFEGTSFQEAAIQCSGKKNVKIFFAWLIVLSWDLL